MKPRLFTRWTRGPFVTAAAFVFVIAIGFNLHAARISPIEHASATVPASADLRELVAAAALDFPVGWADVVIADDTPARIDHARECVNGVDSDCIFN